MQTASSKVPKWRNLANREIRKLCLFLVRGASKLHFPATASASKRGVLIHHQIEHLTALVQPAKRIFEAPRTKKKQNFPISRFARFRYFGYLMKVSASKEHGVAAFDGSK